MTSTQHMYLWNPDSKTDNFILLYNISRKNNIFVDRIKNIDDNTEFTITWHGEERLATFGEE